MIGCIGTAIYFGSFLDHAWDCRPSSTLWVVILLAITAIGAAAFAFVGIKISTRLGLVLEVVSVTAVLVVLITVLIRNGVSAGTDQFTLEGSTFDGVTFGIVLGVLGFVGFESAASLGAEARNPHRTIPRAVLGSAVLVGVLYVFATYAAVLGFGGPDGLAASGAPISELADTNGLSGITWIVDLGVTASFFAVVIACINAASRVLYTMGEEDILPRALGRAHPTHKTPYVAIGLIAPIVAVVPIVMVATGVEALNVIGYTGTIGTFGYMLGLPAHGDRAAVLPEQARRGEPAVDRPGGRRRGGTALRLLQERLSRAGLPATTCSRGSSWAPPPRPGLVLDRPHPEARGAPRRWGRWRRSRFRPEPCRTAHECGTREPARWSGPPAPTPADTGRLPAGG